MISILMTCYNFEKYIGKALESLLQQNCDRPFEIIVVNDASTDNSSSIIQSFQDPRIKFIDLIVNGGARNAVELAFSQSNGEYICRFDGDDYWPPHFLSKAAAILDTNSNVDMVYGDCTIVDNEGTILSAENNIARPQKGIPIIENEFEAILYKYYINAPTIMFRRTAFKRATPIPTCLINFIDWYISLKVLQVAKAYYINEPLAYYRIHPTNMHRLMIANKVGEEVTEFILNEFVINNNSINIYNKRKILAHNYLLIAEKYFGGKMYLDARKNYRKALINNPMCFLNKGFLKHFIGTFIGIKMYGTTRNLIHRITLLRS